MEAAQLRQGALPGQLSASTSSRRSHPSIPGWWPRARPSWPGCVPSWRPAWIPARIEREARIPAEVIDGLKELGALGMKVPEEVRGAGALPGLLPPRPRPLAAAGTPPSRRCSRRTSRSGCRSHCCSSAPRSRSGAPGSRASPAIRSPHSCSPSRTSVPTPPACAHRRAHRGWPRLPDRRRQALGDQRHHRRRGGGAGQGAQGRGPPRRDHRLHRPLPRSRGDRRARQPVHGPARDGELADAVDQRLRPQRERHRRRGPRAPHRPEHPQRRPALASRNPGRAPPSGPPRSPASSPASGCSGASRWASTTRWPRWSPSSRPAPSASRPWST